MVWSGNEIMLITCTVSEKLNLWEITLNFVTVSECLNFFPIFDQQCLSTFYEVWYFGDTDLTWN